MQRKECDRNIGCRISIVAPICVASAASLNVIRTGDYRFVVVVAMLQTAEANSVIHKFSNCDFKFKMFLLIS